MLSVQEVRSRHVLVCFAGQSTKSCRESHLVCVERPERGALRGEVTPLYHTWWDCRALERGPAIRFQILKDHARVLEDRGHPGGVKLWGTIGERGY